MQLSNFNDLKIRKNIYKKSLKILYNTGIIQINTHFFNTKLKSYKKTLK